MVEHLPVHGALCVMDSMGHFLLMVVQRPWRVPLMVVWGSLNSLVVKSYRFRSVQWFQQHLEGFYAEELSWLVCQWDAHFIVHEKYF